MCCNLDEKMDKVATRILASLHRIEEDDFKSEDVIFTNVEAVDAAGVSLPPTLPAVVYFKNSEPVVYKGQSQKYHKKSQTKCHKQSLILI